MLLFTVLAIANPSPELQARFTGVFESAESTEVLDARWEAEVDRVVPSIPWYLRAIARSKLKGARPDCPALSVELTEEVFAVQCVGEDRFERRFDGADEPLVNEQGQPVTVDLRLMDEVVHLDLSSEGGTIRSTYRVDGDALVVSTETTSEHAGEPFRWWQRYVR